MQFLSDLNFENRRVLVIGLGGGCDCIVAYAFVKDILTPLTKDKKTTIVYGNTIGPRDLPDHKQIKDCIFAVPAIPQPLVSGDNFYGNSKIDCSLPRGDEGSPLLFIVKENSGKNHKEVYERNKSAIISDINDMRFDYVFGIDTGGDSLTGGIDWKDHPALGRDRQMLAILTCLNPPTQFWHCMVAPCSDGESSYELMKTYIDRASSDGTLIGTFSCIPMMNTLRELCINVGPTRTPSLMLRAFDNQLETDKLNPQFIILPRGIKPIVPIEWLLTGYLLQWPRNIFPDHNISHI